MPEDTSVNTGVAWPEPEMAGLVVREMQAKLHRWAGDDPARRFDDLYNLVHDPAFLVTAFERVRGNKGARTAGIDPVTVAEVESQFGVLAFLDKIRAELKARTFRPVPVREVMIPKASGKMRSLGIPTVADRVVQAALKLVLEPIFEADFLPCSYGFRPKRRAQDAVTEIHHFTSRGYEWVLEADIQACFDEIDHVALMGRVRTRIGDKKTLGLVRAFLKSGVMTTLGDTKNTLTGTPQGGVLSPLLANIALSVLDDHFSQQWQEEMGTSHQRERRRRQGLGTWRLCRYADLCRTPHKSAYPTKRSTKPSTCRVGGH
jgi:RNA-directed DNA polymerase